MPYRLPRSWTTLCRRIVAMTLIIAFIVGSIGFPVARRPQKDRSQPFPCQDSPCGCQSAEECWRHCCCKTNREKLAWAAEHHVTPPEYVIEAARAESEPGTSRRLCCVHNTQAEHDTAVCEATGCRTERPCCRHKQSCCESGGSHNHDEVEVVLVISDLARKCRGLSPLWSVLNCAVVSVSPVHWSFDWTVVGSIVDVPFWQQAVELPPPVPPPRLPSSAAA